MIFDNIFHPISDCKLVEGVRKGDGRLQRLLYNKCRSYFMATYHKFFFTDKSMAEDVFEESFIILWQKIERGELRGEDGKVVTSDGRKLKCSLNTFLMSIAWRKFSEYSRSHAHYSIEDVYEGMKENLYSEYFTNDDNGFYHEVIDECIAKMPAKCNHILTLFYYHGKSLDDIMVENPTVYASKDALKMMKHRCYNSLKQNVLTKYSALIS